MSRRPEREQQAERVEGGAVLTRKVLITTITGLFTFFLSATLDGPLNITLAEQLILTSVIGGVTLLAQFLIDFERRLADLEVQSANRLADLSLEQRSNIDQARTVIEEGFARISKATELFTALERSALQTDALTRLALRASRINGTSPPIVRDLAQVEIERISGMLKSLGEGNEVIYDGEDQEYLLGLAKSALHSISATSLTTVDAGAAGLDGGFWTSDLGRRYLEAQRSAVDRDVSVRRIFVFDRPFRGSPSFDNLQRLQEEAGVQVRVLESSMVPERLKAGIFDFIVFDRAVCYETMAATPMDEGRPPAIVTTRLVLEDQWVSRRALRFEDLWSAAAEIS